MKNPLKSISIYFFWIVLFLDIGILQAQSHIYNISRTDLKVMPLVATPLAAKPNVPTVVAEKSGRLIVDKRVSGLKLRDRRMYSTECVVDFNNEGALNLSEPSLWFDRFYLPWFQDCGGPFVDIRPLTNSHFHVGYEDKHVLPCPSDEQAYPSLIDDDGNCDFVDVSTEPRTHLTSHTGHEWLLVRGYQDGSFVPFDLTKIRVVGSTPIKLCYQKNQQGEADEWLTLDPDDKPGIWYCWNQLNPGYWDLSEWAWNVSDVKITATNHESVFSIDDLSFGF